MDHQVQNLVLVDNEWVSRPIDVYQALAYARNSENEMPETTTKPIARVPELGILSRTVFASPLFKFICSANIRHKDLNDVVLVGEDAVHLKEIHDYGHLCHIASKSDFSGRILNARVLGEPRQVAISVGSPLPKHPMRHRARRSMTGDEEDVLPSEVMVLTLTSRTLMFLWARHARSGVVSFTQKTVKLPHSGSRLDRFGAFLAVDPKNRAMAVAAPEGAFILYKTKTMHQWRQELRNGQDTTPIEDERIFPIQGRIQHMEFLSSGAGRDDYHIVLLFIIIHLGKTKITCFDWDCRQDLSKATARTERVLVDFGRCAFPCCGFAR